MKRLIKTTALFLLLLIITSCQSVNQPNIIVSPSNLEIIDTTLTWDFVEGVKYYEVKIVTSNHNEFTKETITTFDFSEYLSSNIESIDFFVKALCKDTSYENDSEYSQKITYTNPNFKIEKDGINIPSNLRFENNILYWDAVTNVKYYEIKFSSENFSETIFEISNNFFDFSTYLNNQTETINFYVKSLSKDTSYENDSEYSQKITYTNPNFKAQFEKEILNQSFLNASTAMDGPIIIMLIYTRITL